MTKKHTLSFDENFFNKLGQFGSILSVMMYVSYAFKKERDVPIMIANAPGILFGLVTALTALL